MRQPRCGRMGFARMGFARMEFARMGFARMGFARMGFACMGFARMAFACVAIALAAACASPPSATNANPAAAAQPRPSQPGVCDASKVQWAIGTAGDQATMGRVWRESGAGLFRPLIEGQAPLQDHKPDRVNIHLDANNRIVSIDCG